MNKVCKIAMGICLLSGFTVLHSCTKNEMMEPQVTSGGGENSTLISQEDALKALHSFLDVGASTRSSGYEIESVDLMNSSDLGGATRSGGAEDQPLAYIVNFSRGGYAILGADRRQAPVIAVVDKGSLSADVLTKAKEVCDASDKVSLPDQINGSMAYYLLNSKTGALKTIPDSETRGMGSESAGPFLATEWHQWAPYNSYVSKLVGFEAPVGDAAIGLGQILLFINYQRKVPFGKIFRYTSTGTDNFFGPNWWAMFNSINTPQPADEVYQRHISEFLAHLGYDIIQDYKPEETTYTHSIPMFLSRVFNMTTKQEPFTLDKLRTMLIVRGKPTLLYGPITGPNLIHEGHVRSRTIHMYVVADGCIKRVIELSNPLDGSFSTSQTYMVHIRYNYGGNYDGWYTFGESGTLSPVKSPCFIREILMYNF